MVTWKCVYRMKWVHPPDVKNWLLEQQISYEVVGSEGDRVYNEGKEESSKSELVHVCILVVLQVC